MYLKSAAVDFAADQQSFHRKINNYRFFGNFDLFEVSRGKSTTIHNIN